MSKRSEHGADETPHAEPRAKNSSTLEFPTRSPSVHPPPWMQPGNSAVRTVNFADPRGVHAQQAPAAPRIDPVAEAKAAAKAAEEAAALAAQREAERKAAEAQRMHDELRARTEGFAQAITEAAALRARLIGETEAQLLELAVAIASSIVEREIEIDHDVHTRLVKAALACLGPSDKATLRASKPAFDAIVASFGGNQVEIDGIAVQVICDNNLVGFGCVVETSDSRVDARVQTRLKEVLDGLRDEQQRGAEEAA